ncbi:pirin family protein [Candidimonas nitroreducens]|uniref:Quercetin 2,3-dioxygenase n=1 Tax=Candidimonas nitroreducens TaxID=683354 RepID=A0A225MYI3_9BURK|nr:pirin family protein [Candidimonas nitroreducens]OWT66285.1 quercetin 2,3-dioxygenase [Candidimonas nitroreducens]
MNVLRRATERGHAEHGGWLNSYHTFSFADYYDPEHMGFGALRVINDDRIAASRGFGAHPHRDMEIITYPLAGSLRHQDSMGHGSTIRPGIVQRMSAGRGVVHSEMNPSPDTEAHILQIWIEPNVRGITPEYEEKSFDEVYVPNALVPILSPDGRASTMRIHQDALMYAGRFDGELQVVHTLQPGRKAWLHVARGDIRVNGQDLHAGDALAVSGEAELRLERADDAEVLLFDLA